MRPATSEPSSTVVVVTWQGAHLLPACLASLRGQTLRHRVLVVDNASSDGTAQLLAAHHPEAEVLTLPTNTGFAGGVHAALGAIRTPYTALLNNDAVADPEWLMRLVDHLDQHPEVAAVTSRMLLAHRDPPTMNNAGVLILPNGYGADRGLGESPDAYATSGPVFGFSGGAALLRTDAVRSVGGFPAPFFLYYEDTDTSWRLRNAGWEISYEPAAVVHHEHSATSDQSSASFAFYNERNRLLMHVRCGRPADAVAVWARFLLTTGSLLGRRVLGQPVPRAHQQRLATRWRVAGSALRLLPWALRSRSARSST